MVYRPAGVCVLIDDASRRFLIGAARHAMHHACMIDTACCTCWRPCDTCTPSSLVSSDASRYTLYVWHACMQLAPRLVSDDQASTSMHACGKHAVRPLALHACMHASVFPSTIACSYSYACMWCSYCLENIYMKLTFVIPSL